MHTRDMENNVHTDAHLCINKRCMGRSGPLEAFHNIINNWHPSKLVSVSQRPTEVAVMRGIFAFLDSD